MEIGAWEGTWEALDEAALLPRRSRAGAIESILKIGRGSDPDGVSPAWQYLIGYALYCHPARNFLAVVQDQVEVALNRVLALDPAHSQARMLLGNHAYDLGRWDQAMLEFERIDSGDADLEFAIRLAEMKVCAEIRRSGLGAGLPHLWNLVHTAERSGPEDVPLLAHLGKALRGWAFSVSEAELAEIRELARRLDRASSFSDSSSWFTEIVSF